MVLVIVSQKVPVFNINFMKKINKKLICFSILMLLCFNVFVPLAGAESLFQNLSDFKSAAGLPGSEDTSVLSIISGIINTVLSLLGLIFIILLMYAGFTYMTAQGDDKKVTKAKDTIKNAIIGVAIVILSYAISRIVFTVVLSITTAR